MNKKKTILIIFLTTAIITGGIISTRSAVTLPKAVVEDPKNTNVAVGIFPKVTYTPDGKLDTREWIEYKSEYGGFSVRAPKEDSGLVCGRDCDPARDGERFNYTLVREDGPGIPGMSVFVIKKEAGTTLDTWLSTYIVSGNNQISSAQKTSIQDYSALQFDMQIKDGISPIIMEYSVYPNGTIRSENIRGNSSISYRFIVIDLKDRYAVISHTLTINKNFLEYLNTSGYAGPLTPTFFDNNSLSGVYQVILNSFKAFPQKKS